LTRGATGSASRLTIGTNKKTTKKNLPQKVLFIY